MRLTITKIATAQAAAVLTAGAAIAGCAGTARPTVIAAVKRAVAPSATSAGLSPGQGAKICSDLNAWLAGAVHEADPRFNSQLQSDEDEAGYSTLGTDLLMLDSNLVNMNSAALQNSRPDYYPVTGLGALRHDCAAYGVSVEEVSS